MAIVSSTPCRRRGAAVWRVLVLWLTACAPDLQLAAGPDGRGQQTPDAATLADTTAADLSETRPDSSTETGLPTLDAGPNCAGVLCTGHGSCEQTTAGPRCVCDDGYVAGPNLSCLDASYCPAGEVRAAGACVPVASLTSWCADYCGSLGLACPAEPKHTGACQPYCDHASEQGPDCVANCLATLDESGQAERVVCGGLMRRFDSVDCRNLAFCEAPSAPPPVAGCVNLCAAAADCGLLLDSRLLLGSTPGECQVYCSALHRALAPFGRAQLVHQCLQQAMTSCNPIEMLGCMVVGVPELSSKLCTTAAADCGYIPDVWSDAQACAIAFDGFGPGQRIAVGGCLEIGGNYANCKQNACAQPPAQLPVGAQQAAQTMMDHCPHLLAAPGQYPFGSAFYAWMYVAILRAFGRPIDVDYSLISSCFLAKPCPQTKAGTLQCLLSTP